MSSDRCKATTDTPWHGRACCLVDWPHIIHLGWAGKVRVRWMDGGGEPDPATLAAFDGECEARQVRPG